MDVAFLTFGGPMIGMGHVYRSIAIAQWANHLGLSCRFRFYLCEIEGVDGTGAASRLERAEVGEVRVLPGGTTFCEKCDLLVIDRLAMPLSLMSEVRHLSKIVVSIDDAGPAARMADIMLNPLYRNRSLSAHRNSKKWGQVELEGPWWQVIHPSFSATPLRPSTSVKEIVLMQGSSDPHQLLPSIIREVDVALGGLRDIRLNVLAGGAPSRSPALSDAISSYKGPICAYEGIEDMAHFLSQMDIAISAAGVTAFELAALGVPAILVTGEEKELETSAALASIGAAVDIGRYGTRVETSLRSELTALVESASRRDTLRQNARRAVDGLAGERLWKRILSLSNCLP